ncbi:hypothetical protein KY366_03415 [Candidatus Woesearchaeota archaeon]|nr:hypothetical protein [Candidatus Woesearchaeota archaeon]
MVPTIPGEPRIADYEHGRKLCGYCTMPVYDPRKALVNGKTEQLYHQEPCFKEASNRPLEDREVNDLENRGVDTSTLSPEMIEMVKILFGIPDKPK